MKYTAKLLFASSRFTHVFGDGGAPDSTEILTGLLSTVYKLDANTISEILKDGTTAQAAIDAVKAHDVERVKKIQIEAAKGKLKEGENKGKSEGLTQREKELKEHYGVESDKIGIELMDEIISKKAGEGAAKNDEDIKKSSFFQQQEAIWKKQVADAKKAHTDEVTQIKTEHAKASTFSKVGESAMTLLTGLNPVFSTNATVAETQKKTFLNSLSGFDYEEKDGKILVSKDGALQQDQHGHTLDFAEHVKAIATTHFDFAANNGGANPGGAGGADKSKGGAGGGAAYPAGVTKPKNATELAAIMDRGDLKPEQKRVVMDTYRSENGKK
jgi:hypothetical protein